MGSLLKSTFASGLIIMVLALVSACGDSSKNPQSSQSPDPNQVRIPQNQANLDYKSAAVVLLQGAGLYVEKDGAVTWKASATIGELYKYNNDIRKLKRDKDERDFARITNSDGVDYWIQTVFIAAQAKVAIVNSDEVVIFKKADVTSAQGTIIPRDTILAYFPETEKNGFVSVSAYVEATNEKVLDHVFVKKDKLNTDENDVRALQLLTVAKTVKKDVAKKEILKSALELNSSYSSEIQKLLDEGQVSRPTEQVSLKLFTNDKNINVRSQPIENSAVVTMLDRGVEVNVVEKTTSLYSVSGAGENYWYKSQNPEGWIFGTFLSESVE